MEFRGVFYLEEGLNKLARFWQAIAEEIGEGEVVTVVVGGRIGVLGAFEIGDGFGELVGAGVEFAEIVIGVVGTGIEGDGFFELGLGEIGLAELNQNVARDWCAAEAEFGFEADGGLEMLKGLVVLRLRCIDEAEEFVEFETLRGLGEEFFELGGGFGIMAGFILSDGGLEIAIQAGLLG